MKTIQTLFIAFFLSLGLVANAQEVSVDQILANYFENTGGLENWKNLESIKMKGKMATQGLEFPMSTYQAAPDKLKREIDIQGKTLVMAYDGENAWTINPMQNITEPTLMPEAQAAEMKSQEFESPFIDYKDKGHTVELDGTEEIEGTETYKVKLTKKDESIEYYFFDTENFVPIMVRSFVKMGPQKGQASEVYLSDYQEAGDFILPYSTVIKNNGQTIMTMEAEEYELNAEIDESVFAFPKK